MKSLRLDYNPKYYIIQYVRRRNHVLEKEVRYLKMEAGKKKINLDLFLYCMNGKIKHFCAVFKRAPNLVFVVHGIQGTKCGVICTCSICEVSLFFWNLLQFYVN